MIAAGIVGAWPTPAIAATEPRLGTAANFAILAGSTITSTGNTVINGNLGLDPGTSVTGFPPGIVVGVQHIHPDAVANTAKSDLQIAYNDALIAPSTSNLTGQDLGGMTLPSGVYTFNSSAGLTGTLHLTGTGVFIFQIGSTLTTAANSAVVLDGGAQACAVYWQITSSATLGVGTQLQGNLMALASISMSSGASIVTGRAMAITAAVTLIDNTITAPTVPCVPVPPPSADIGITKTVDNATPSLGSNVTFTVTATNHGPDNATGVQVTDTLPAGLSLVSATPSAGTYAAGVWNLGALTNGASASLSIVATVTSTAAQTNTATKSAEDQIDPVSANNSASATVTALGADIGITKTVDNSAPNLGSNVTFTVTATNNGPGNATGVKVTDFLPPGLSFVSALPSTGVYDSGTGVWNIGALANATNATLSIVASVTSIAALTNTASKSAEDQVDPVSGNNTASATVTALGADIGITKTVDNSTPNLGSNVTFTIIATNHGPGNATGVTVSDLLPAGLSLVSAVTSAGTYIAGTGVWTIGALTNGANAALVIVATVTSTAALTNTATKTAEAQIDPVSGNNTASATVTALGADIGITKTVDNSTPNLGSNVTFTIIATNNGPGNATGVKVTDMLPPGLTLVLANPSTGTYGSGVWNIGSLANGANATLSIVATVTVAATLTNTATKTAEDQLDSVPANDSASATINPIAADIGITKTVDNSTPNLGSNVTFTITATNHGPSNATGVKVTDLLPVGLTLVSTVPSTGTYIAGVWSIGPLNNGASATLSIVATVTGTAAVTNTASKTAEDQVDSFPANNSSSVTINPVAADIGITKTVDNATPNVGSNVTFTISATNHGPSNASGVQVTDLLPPSLTFVSATPSAGTYNALNGLWIIGPLSNGGNASLAITAAVSSASPATNTARKTAEDQVDSVPANDSASATITPVSVILSPVAADIAITKTVDNSIPSLGSNVIFTVTAINNGPSNATGVQVTDLLPSGLTFVSATPSAGTYNAANGLWIIGPIANGGKATLSITATVTRTTPVTNTATKTAEVELDLIPSNDSASATVTGQPADTPALPGLPNTSAPAVNAGGSGPTAPKKATALVLASLAVVVAALGLLGLPGIGLRSNRARVGLRRSRRRQRQNSQRLVIALLAIVASLAMSSISVGELASYPGRPVAALAPTTQLIGTKVVSVAPPAAPQGETLHHVAGPITPSRLRIPTIGVDSTVNAVGLRADGSMDVPDNLWTSAWLANGPRPGEAGNAVVAGHRGVGTPALFSHLEKVQPGDRIYVSDVAGNELIYVVTRVESLDLSNSTRVAVFKQTPTQQLVLITCFGAYIKSARTYDHRLVVFSQPLPLRA